MADSNSKQRSQSTATSNASTQQKPESSISTEWTDEKHSLYLKSIEASFVNQLYDSLDLINFDSQIDQPFSQTRKTSKPVGSPSGQFKVLRDGFWQEIKFTRPGFKQNKVDESNRIMTSPWIKHYKSTTKLPGCEAKDKGTVHCSSAVNSEQPCHYWSHRKICGENVGAALEVSDQNFVNEDQEGDKGNEGKSSMDGAKRVKTREGGTSSTDQVVPLGRPRPTLNDDVPKPIASLGG